MKTTPKYISGFRDGADFAPRAKWRTFRATLFVVLLAALSSSAYAEEVRILTYNIRNGRGLASPDVDLERPTRVIREIDPHVVGLQEVDRLTRRSGGRDIPRELGTLTQREVEYASAIDFDGGEYGVATLSSQKPIRSYKVPLPGKEERRVLQVVEFEHFVLFNTHFSLMKESRINSISILEQERKKFTKPVVLCGDLNATPDSETISELRKNWRILSPSVPTFPADAPTIQIDYVLVPIDAPIEVREACVWDAPKESDHRPVCVLIEINVELDADSQTSAGSK
ncbi:MAG: endonuclease/exonuclease/phosphatase family protein [Planctomycetia bacterium]|nr:endonuclease/exonuclease/phosphatase family protein [Planctomycetia bacterium]